ncbi:DUF2500 domain-containing protein [Bacillus shivajii]|uniref:DUF2500 domain-containing protein n=1 Tax=Bacillus shivajii TaxID=1983719 RepID=UPI001CF9B181|nr:DUF2500 domain-containing protein [Bacillus shivajii]UCZ54241.1 DUF2500 domain-containing protein [Bacillus shivajii]
MDIILFVPGTFANFIPIIIGLIFFIVIGTILYQLFNGIREWARNNQLPRETVKSKIVSKRTDVRKRAGKNHRTYTTYFVTFELEDGSRKEFKISGREYGQLAEGDVGNLTHQGTRYHGFERIGSV